jgi:hypothetical protein
MPAFKNLIAFFGPPWPDLELLSSLFVVGDEELFHLRQKGLVHVHDVVYIRVVVGMNCHAEQSIVGFRLPLFRLLRVDDADDTYLNEAADIGRGAPVRAIVR